MKNQEYKLKEDMEKIVREKHPDMPDDEVFEMRDILTDKMEKLVTYITTKWQPPEGILNTHIEATKPKKLYPNLKHQKL